MKVYLCLLGMWVPLFLVCISFSYVCLSFLLCFGEKAHNFMNLKIKILKTFVLPFKNGDFIHVETLFVEASVCCF